jgi:hypothetical protein
VALLFSTSGNAGLKSAGILTATPCVAAIQSASNALAAVSSITATFASAQTNQNTNLLFISCSIAGDISTVVDTAGNTYALVTSETNGLFNLYCYSSIGIASASAGSNTVTVTFTASVTSSLSALEYTNIAFVAANQGKALGTTGTASTITLFANWWNAVMVCGAIGDGLAAPTAGTGFTMQQSGTTTGLAYGVEDAVLTNYATGNAGVVCGQTGIATANWTTIAVSLVPPMIPAPGLDGTLSFFFMQPTLVSNAQTFVQFVAVSTNAWQFNITSTNDLQFTSNAGGTSTTFGPAIVANTWYFAAASVWGNGQHMVVYFKEVTGPCLQRTVIGTTSFFNATDYPQALFIGAEGGTPNNNTAEFWNEFYGGCIRSVRFWPNQVLSQAQLEVEAQALVPAMTAGVIHIPFSVVGDTTDIGSTTLQMLLTNGGSLTVGDEPPVANTRTRRPPFKHKASTAGVTVTGGLLEIGASPLINMVGGIMTANNGAAPLVVTAGRLTVL